MKKSGAESVNQDRIVNSTRKRRRAAALQSALRARERFNAQPFNDSTVPRQRHEFPINFSVPNFKQGHAWRRTTVGPSHAAWIEKQNATAFFVAWDVRVRVQDNFDIIGWMIRRNMLQAEF